MQAPIIAGQLPAAYCYPSSAQQLLNDFAQISYANVPDHVTGVAVGPTDPGPDFPLWYSTTFSLMFELRNGIRVHRYPVEADPKIKMLTEKTPGEIIAWDNPGLLAAPVAGAADHTGPFWEIDHNYDGRYILGPGALPLSGTVIAVATIGGAERVVLELKHVPRHRHSISVGPESGDSSYLPDEVSEVGTFKVNGAEQVRFYNLASTEVGRTREAGSSTDPPDPLVTMPQYRAAYVVQRTARIWITP